MSIQPSLANIINVNCINYQLTLYANLFQYGAVLIYIAEIEWK